VLRVCLLCRVYVEARVVKSSLFHTVRERPRQSSLPLHITSPLANALHFSVPDSYTNAHAMPKFGQLELTERYDLLVVYAFEFCTD
jgi:hypothetical protein